MGNLKDSLRALVESGALSLRDAEVALRRSSEVASVRYNGRRKKGKKSTNYTSKTYRLAGETFNFDVVNKDDTGLLARDERAVLIGPGGLPPKVRTANKVWSQCEQYGIGAHKPAKFSVSGFYCAKHEAAGQGRAIADLL